MEQEKSTAIASKVLKNYSAHDCRNTSF